MSDGVPGRVAAALANGSFIETEPVRVAREWQATNAGILVLSGPVGCGKSVAAAWLLANSFRVVGTYPDELDGDTRKEHRVKLSGTWIAAAALVEASDFDPAFWKPLRTVDLLVIDEAGSERVDGKGRALGNFTELLRRRYDDDRRSIVTTNLPPAAWMKLYGDADGGRLRDRLAEAEVAFGRSPVVALKGASLRGRAAP